jgi:GT2 family glycosyltransferase
MQQPLLSVALPIYNQHDQIETTLTALYECQQVPMEVILIDDASTDDTREVIHSVLDYYQHERTFFFEHSQHWGRGNTLNEALQQISAPYVWTPGAIEEIHEDVLLETLDRLSKQPAAGAYMGFDPLPETVEQWLGLLEADVLPSDDLFLWQVPHIPMPELFFSPYVSAHHGAELAIRLQYHNGMETADPFFALSTEDELPDPDRTLVSEFIYTLLRRPDLTASQTHELLNVLHALHDDVEALEERFDQLERDTQGQDDLESLFEEAYQHYQEGEISAALELLTRILTLDPDQQEARQLKIQLLERQRRYVEASELKHQPRGQQKPSLTQSSGEGMTSEPNTEATEMETESESSEPLQSVDIPDRTEDAIEEEDPAGSDTETPNEASTTPPEPEEDVDIRTTVIIPTTADSKPLLEACLVQFAEQVDPHSTQLIIVDNASLDDTFEYLKQLQEDRFYHLEVVTHPQNVGFARSVNEGIKRAEGDYICVMHSDVMLESDVPGAMADLLDEEGHHEIGLLAPLTTNTLNPQQEAEESHEDEDLLEVDYVDSFFMMWRADLNLTMDEQYGAAFFEDLDFCLQVQNEGKRIMVAPQLWVDHFGQTISQELGLTTNSRTYWENAAYFNEKWQIPATFPTVQEDTSDWEKLCILGEMINPFVPEDTFVELFEEWFSSEARAQMLSPERTVDEQSALMHLMMTMDQRDTLRQLEDEVEGEELPIGLIMRLVEFYFERHIYSRCKHYLELVDPKERPLELYISELKIAVKEREMSKAIELLGSLMDAAPVHPTLLELAGEIHHFKGNSEEAAQFFDLAQQLYPNSLRPDAEVVQNDYI